MKFNIEVEISLEEIEFLKNFFDYNNHLGQDILKQISRENIIDKLI